MPYFSQDSLDKLATCHIDLQILFKEVIKYFDCKVTCGFRNEIDQSKAYAEGKTQLQWPNGNHNHNPSTAVDVYPYPINMDDIKRFYYFAGFVKGIAQKLLDERKISHAIRWGGNWDNDTDVSANDFNDLPHYELLP